MQGYEPVQAPPPVRAKRRFNPLMILLMIVSGAAGSLGAVAALGKGSVNVAPFVIELEVLPSATGTTRLALDPAATGLLPYDAEAKTHASPLEFRATVTGVTTQGLLDPSRGVRDVAQNPRELSGYLREHGRAELRAYGLRLGLLAALGGLAGGLLVGLGQWKRTLFTMVAGLVFVGALGAFAGATYDVNQFQSTQLGRSG